MEFKEIINAIRQYPWQVTVAVISLIPLYIIDLKFLAKRKVGLSRKIEIAKERGHVTKGMKVVDKICEDADPMDDNGTIAQSKQPVIKTITVSEIND